MRYVYLALIAVLTGIFVVFMLQNLGAATVSLFSMSITLPLALLVLLVYALGMLTGGFALQFVLSVVRQASKHDG